MQHLFTKLVSGLILLQLLTACGDGSSTQLTGTSTTASSRITINITDAPVDAADDVVVEFTAVTLKSEGNDDLTFTFDVPKSINLLALQGGASQPLLDNVEIPDGNYTQIRLAVNAELDSVMDSYITLNSTQHELRIPSGSQSGLKINTPFTISAATDEHTVFTIDFDLRKSIVNPKGKEGYFLKPTLRLIHNIRTGSLGGTINPELLLGNSCSDNDPATGNAVYVFSDFDTVPDDVDETGIEPITTALINIDSITTNSTIYTYEVGFLPEGNYTVAFTCAADRDDDEDNADVTFKAVYNVTIIAGEATSLIIGTVPFQIF